MDVGMLWGNSEEDLKVGVGLAVDHYAKKYGLRPTLCYINPNDAGENFVNPEKEGDELPEIDFDGVKIRKRKIILKKHFWLGFVKKRSAT